MKGIRGQKCRVAFLRPTQTALRASIYLPRFPANSYNDWVEVWFLKDCVEKDLLYEQRKITNILYSKRKDNIANAVLADVIAISSQNVPNPSPSRYPYLRMTDCSKR